ncbi:hypothetical protein ACPVPU_10610 [Sphingomonas sp. CJ99]
MIQRIATGFVEQAMHVDCTMRAVLLRICPALLVRQCATPGRLSDAA